SRTRASSIRPQRLNSAGKRSRAKRRSLAGSSFFVAYARSGCGAAYLRFRAMAVASGLAKNGHDRQARPTRQSVFGGPARQPAAAQQDAQAQELDARD